MELILERQVGSQVLVICDNQPSHAFDLLTLLPHKTRLTQPLDDPVTYGQAAYAALFPPETLARQALANTSERILLITTDNDLDAIPWEYAYGPDGFLVLECHFVRGLPTDQRIAAPVLDQTLHIVAVPSNPLSRDVEPLEIEGEWMRLKDIIQQVPYALTLERSRPPTIEQVRSLVANRRQRVVHFMGHGGQQEAGAVLCFEQDNGDLDLVTAKQFMLRVRGTVFLVTLNACVTATPGDTTFSNLAAALVRQKTPYALGMRFSIPDEDARAFSRAFYSDLARGSSIEEALLQARLTHANSPRPWSVGVPVLYTSLAQPAAGFASLTGSPLIEEHQPRIEVSVLPRAEGAFQGRVDELKALGTALTDDSRPPLITIHGAGGQGKTALAREAVERFGYACPGGVWATSLENLPSRELFVSDLARFLGIDTQTVVDSAEVERLVIARLVHRRMLIVLDNAETLVDAIEANNEEAIRLAQFLREQLPRPPVSLLATSRSFLGWTSEIGCELTGLAPIESIKLFRQHVQQREKEIDHVKAWELSEQVEGHPLSLRLLGSAFNASSITFSAFFKEYEAQLLGAENKYVRVDHRHRTLYASIEISVRYLDDGLADLLSKLWLFHAPFLPNVAVEIFDPAHDDTKDETSPVHDWLYALWRRGLLTHEEGTVREGMVLFYRVLPTIRPYIEKYLARDEERESLLARFGVAYAELAAYLYHEINRGGVAAFIAFQSREDLERAVSCVTGVTRGYYLLRWGWVLQRLGNTSRGLKQTEQALEIGQGQDRQLELQALNNMAMLSQATGHPWRALELNQQNLLLFREVGDRAGEAATLNNMAEVYRATGQPRRALELFEQALPLLREVGNRAGEAASLNGQAGVYLATGEPGRAFEMLEQALPLLREVGDRAGEATTLNNMALVNRETGQPQRALELYERALPLLREVGNRAGEANTLNNMAMLYQATGQPRRALELFEQVLPLRQEVGDRAGEAVSLNNMAEVYRAMGQLRRALELFEQALPLRQEVGDRAGEATTLNNMAVVYRAMGQLQRALELYEQNLPPMREVGDRAGEAATLNNMAEVYRVMGQPQRALELFEQALPLRREVGDRAGEANTLNSLAYLLRDMQRYEEALAAFEQSIQLEHAMNHVAGEVAGLVGIALLLYQHLNRPQEAITKMEQAIALLETTEMPQSASGETMEDLHRYLDTMRQGLTFGQASTGPTTMSPEQLQTIVSNTVAVMTTMTERRTEWHEIIVNVLQDAQQRGVDWHIEVEFFTAVLAILDGNTATLRDDHPYAPALAQIQEGIAAGGLESDETPQDGELPFDAELIPRSIKALLGNPQEKMAHMQYLIAQTTNARDENLKGFLKVIQLALFSDDLSQLGRDLSGIYRQAWEAIVASVEAGGTDPRVFDLIIRNTLAVLGPSFYERGDWRNNLAGLRNQAAARRDRHMVALLDEIIRLLDAGGNPVGLGEGLRGIYAKTWQAIFEGLSSQS